MFEKGFSLSGYERDALFLNLGTGRFLDVSGASGIDSITDGRAAVFADFDNDGDFDVFLTTHAGPGQLLFRNNVGQASGFLRLSLEGVQAGRDAYGAVVRVRTSAGTLTKVKSGGSGFLSQHDPRLLFGVGRDSRAESVEVAWPNGVRERFEGDFAAGSSWLLRQGAGRARAVEVRSTRLPDALSATERAARSLRLAVGRALPDVAVTTLDGGTRPLRSLLQPGRRTLVNLWATWCAPCAREMPELDRLRPALAARGIDLLGLNLDTEPGTDVAGYLKQRSVTYPCYRGGAPAVEALYASDELTVPLSFLVDDAGVVLEVLGGWSEETRRRLAALAGPR
jgi:thiol-disulfide isomerase/thioredoxin